MLLQGSAHPSDLGSRCSTSVAKGMCLDNCRNEVAYILLVSVIKFAVWGQVKHSVRKPTLDLTLCLFNHKHETHL